MNEVAADVEDPEKKISVARRARLRRIEEAHTPAERRDVRERRNLRIGALGSGSDYTSFLQHLGIASVHLGYGGEGGGGIYHSIYDDFSWYTRFSDGEFVYGRALAQTTGRVLLRLANADLLPFDFTGLAETIGTYVKEVRDLAQEKREKAEEQARQLDEGLPDAVMDPREPEASPTRETPVPFFDFSPLENASDSLTRAAREFDQAAADALSAPARDARRLAEANALVRSVERTMLREEGLPRRPWFKHFVYAPGFYTGYDVKTLPAVREAIEEKQWRDVNPRIVQTAQAIEACAARIREAARKLKR